MPHAVEIVLQVAGGAFAAVAGGVALLYLAVRIPGAERVFSAPEHRGPRR